MATRKEKVRIHNQSMRAAERKWYPMRVSPLDSERHVATLCNLIEQITELVEQCEKLEQKNDVLIRTRAKARTDLTKLRDREQQRLLEPATIASVRSPRRRGKKLVSMTKLLFD